MPSHSRHRKAISRVSFSRFLYPLYAILLLTVATSAHADSVDELRALVDAGDATGWDMAQRMEDDNAGDADFDFWYGLAAKAAGQKHQAVFAFERVLGNQPGNARAKLELGDIYYQFGNTREARILFEEVLATTPPGPVEQRIRTYLGAIEAVDKKKKTNLNGYVTFAGGHDSNVNSATSTATHAILDNLLVVSLPASALETDAGFGELRAGLDLIHPVNQRDSRFLSASIKARDNEDLFSGGNSDYTQAALTGGWSLQRGTAHWRIPVGVQSVRVEDDESSYLASVGTEYNRPLSVNTAVAWFGQLAVLHYPSQEERNTRQLVLGGAWHWNSISMPLRLTVSGHAGHEPTEESSADYNGRDFVATRLSLRYPLSSRQTLYGALGLQQSNYLGEQPLLGFKREELLADASFGWQMRLSPDWTLNADLSYQDNMSVDNELFDYQRSVAMLGATWRF